ncbi:MAG: hypothetical protein FWE16_02145 [Firmicutes bacterium]|nr:hypothetical protein [Bacillota bacterium]
MNANAIFAVLGMLVKRCAKCRGRRRSAHAMTSQSMFQGKRRNAMVGGGMALASSVLPVNSNE